MIATGLSVGAKGLRGVKLQALACLVATPLMANEDLRTYRVFPENVEFMHIEQNGEYLCFTREEAGKSEGCELWLFKWRASEDTVLAYPIRKFEPWEAEAVGVFGAMPPAQYQTEPVVLSLLRFSRIVLLEARAQ